jgi:hypothetical protein
LFRRPIIFPSPGDPAPSSVNFSLNMGASSKTELVKRLSPSKIIGDMVREKIEHEAGAEN